MQDGRQKAAQRSRQAAVQRVKNFREWMDADKEYWTQLRAFTDYGTPMKVTKPRPPATGIPSDNDYAIARQEGAIS